MNPDMKLYTICTLYDTKFHIRIHSTKFHFLSHQHDGDTTWHHSIRKCLLSKLGKFLRNCFYRESCETAFQMHFFGFLRTSPALKAEICGYHDLHPKLFASKVGSLRGTQIDGSATSSGSFKLFGSSHHANSNCPLPVLTTITDCLIEIATSRWVNKQCCQQAADIECQHQLAAGVERQVGDGIQENSNEALSQQLVEVEVGIFFARLQKALRNTRGSPLSFLGMRNSFRTSDNLGLGGSKAVCHPQK